MKARSHQSYKIHLHRNDINRGDGGDGTAVSLQLIAVGTRHCRLLACHSGAAGINIISRRF